MNTPPGGARTTSTTRRFDPAGTEDGSWIAPHVSQQARDHLDDLGLVDDDATENLRANRSAPVTPVSQHRAGTDQNHPTSHHNREGVLKP
ncbi:hypothetical protein [Mycolicibacterium sp. XJ870]